MQKLFDCAREQLQLATANRHRLLITLSGDQLWAEQHASDLLDELDLSALWVSDHPANRANCIDQNASRRWLGRELDGLVFDAHGGFDPNVFSLLCGTVRAGGALILLTPALDTWAQHPDPVNKRCSVWGAEVRTSRYLHRLARRVPGNSQLLLQQDGDLHCTAIQRCVPEMASNEQTNLIQSIVSRFSPRTTPQLEVISGDRGRGKSAALGLLAAELVRDGARHIIITAPRKAATNVLMQHALEHWPADAPALQQCVTFAAPDHLAFAPQPCDALLLDEMGGIHLGLLQRLLSQYSVLIMAGTIHGYEGAGRGFHTRLRRHIAIAYPHCQWHQLIQPMRWAKDDPLERACNALMLLDAEPSSPIKGTAKFCLLDRDELVNDERLLRQVHGLLASAHYRTRPLDLRQMLDGPNIQVATAQINDTVVAACLIAAEGPMSDDTLNQNIAAGKRRPSGHLLPQLLMQRLQLFEAAAFRYWRIVRIAVHPTLQNRGLGSEFLAFLEQQATRCGIDCLGSLFAVDLAVLKFWQSAGYQAVTLGDNCEATSGSYALSILKPLNNATTTLAHTASLAWGNTQRGTLAESHPALTAELAHALGAALKAEVHNNGGKLGK